MWNLSIIVLNIKTNSPVSHLIFPVLSINNIKKVISDNFVKEWREKVLKNPYLDLDVWFDSFLVKIKQEKQGIYIPKNLKIFTENFL